MAHSLLQPVYTQFDFAELPRGLVANIVQEALSYRQ
jgi:hypothetical protein